MTDGILTIADNNRTVIGSAPLALNIKGEAVAWDPQIGSDGRTLTAAPINGEGHQDGLANPVGALAGFVGGAMIGMLGLVAGVFTLGLLMPVTAVVGLGAGAIIRFTVGGQGPAP
ncbi:hypothetical protein JK358_00870 [Nocardia sp. 2]|uniref:DUF8020 domain-containing protein n=1 Tax=Nocardia acididurans TaxID=2802282 RepID=A0ABS1LX95_9NOCA|nr:hypothetical protein [Nocardia acididurans]MBL1072942.1 hypothetical protein [Nocardia acididurans]